jgi:hypothetical protein
MFALLPDRHLAGELAGHFFRIETWLGVVLGAIALLLLKRRVVDWVARLDFVLIGVAIAGPLASELILRPIMEDARVVGDMGRFGFLHGVSALLFVCACLASLLVVWRLSAPPSNRSR